MIEGGTGKDPVIIAEGLTKVFRDFWRRPKVRALDSVSFQIQKGEVVGLLGPNGAGKTTAIKLLLGLLHPTRGLLRVLGRSPRHVKSKERIGYLSEESFLYDHLTAEETLDFYGRLFDLGRNIRKERINQLLEMIGLKHARRRAIGEFSKGMARRIGIAQALINDPELMVLDEPTSGLDPIGCREVKDLILTLAKRGKTILLSSHLLADVEDVCDRIIILYNGRVCASGTVQNLLEDQTACRLTMPSLSPDTLKEVLEIMRQKIGNTPDVDRPQKDLEQFFLEVVQKAQEVAAVKTGVDKSAGVAGYLAREPERTGKTVLDELIEK